MCTYTNRGFIFYLPLKEASAAESGSEHSLRSYLCIASEQWGEGEGHLPPAMTFEKSWSTQLQSLQKMFFSLVTTTLIYTPPLLSQVGLWHVQMRRSISRFRLTNLQIVSGNFPFSLCLTPFAHTELAHGIAVLQQHLFFRCLYLPQNTEKSQLISVTKQALKSKWVVSNRKLNKSSLLPWLPRNELGSF